MCLLESVAIDAGLAAQPDAETLGFDLDGDLWTLDPKHPGRMLTAGASGAPALIMKCRPTFLLRLLTGRGVAFERDDEVRLVGNPNALRPLIRALSRTQSLLACRQYRPNPARYR
jgi:hypothetical protein